MQKSHEKYVLTCQSGLESLVKNECKRLGLQNIVVQDRLISCEGPSEDMYRLLIWSRFANRVYISLAERKVSDFDELFALSESVHLSEYLTGKEHIVIEASSSRSALSSVPKIQSVGQKALFSTLRTPNNTNGIEVHILILIIDDVARILLDVTGDPLHKRGYRKSSGEAPIKENLAAALLAFSSWRYKTPLLDPFCGSGTILIEAALLARNIAPGLSRHFRIESLPFFEREIFEKVKKEAKEKIYPSGNYTLIGQDIDESVLEIAQENAKKAGVEKDIIFRQVNYLDTPPKNHVIITNPPYGKRLMGENLEEIYTKLEHEITQNSGGFITSYPIAPKNLENKKLLNGSEECRFWYKKSI